jgi:hypothetical protein
MVNTREIAAAVIGGVMLMGAGAYLYVTYREKAPAPAQQAADSDSGTLHVPTIDDMCKAMGATAGDALKQCQSDEQAAGEFVVAWMGFNNFIVNGEISLDQIQAIASLDDTSPVSGADPSLGGDPSLGYDPSIDPSLGGDPSAPSQITAGIDPVTGQPLGFLQSPAQLALYCLQMAGDWVTLHDCISENDPSTHIDGTP